MPKCVFCGRIYDNPRGLTLVMVDGTINYLCSSKCRKNMFMRRRKVRWIADKTKVNAKEIQASSTEEKAVVVKSEGKKK